MSKCKLPKNAKLVFGSGGSKTIIAITKDKVYKYFPIILSKTINKNELKYDINDFKAELIIGKKLTELNISHIVSFYKVYYCDEIPTHFFKHCEKYIDYLLSENKAPTECMYLYKNYPNTIHKGVFVAELEYCDNTLAEEIKKVSKLSNKKIKEFLDRLIFQTIYTLEKIKKKYPHFIHGDLFIRNILSIDTDDDEDYELDGKKYKISGNGLHIKLNDFGLTQLDKKITKKYKTYLNFIEDEYRDIFALLYDLYNGANLGGDSFMSLIKNKKKQEFIRSYFSQFMDIDMIDKIRKHKKMHLNNDWKKTLDTEFVDLIKLKEPREIMEIAYSGIQLKND